MASPIEFTRGASFQFVMKIPDKIDDGTFFNWTLRCQVRKEANEAPSGFISEVPVYWLDTTTTRALAVKQDATDNWPIGPAEFDVLFTSPAGERVRSKRVPFHIVRGVTRRD